MEVLVHAAIACLIYLSSCWKYRYGWRGNCGGSVDHFRKITEFGNGRDSKIRSRPYWYRSGYQNIARSTRLGNRQVKSRFVFYRHDRHGGDGQQSNNQEEYHVQGPIDISEGGQQSKIKDAYHRNDVCISCLRATVSPFFQHAGQSIAPSSPSITSTASGVQLYQCAEQQYQRSHKFNTWELQHDEYHHKYR